MKVVFFGLFFMNSFKIIREIESRLAQVLSVENRILSHVAFN